MRMQIAAVLAAVAVVLGALFLCGVLSGIIIVVPMTVGFVAAWTGILAAAEEETSTKRRWMALGAAAVGTVVLIIASVHFFRSVLGSQ